MKQVSFNTIAQVGLTVLTVFGFLLTSLKLPQYGLIVALASEVFWLYSSYKAWRKANQIGMFITTIILTVTILFGVLNYWVL